MKSLIILIFLSFLVSGCSKKEVSSGKQSAPDTLENKTENSSGKISGEGTAKDVTSESGKIEMHKFNVNDLPSSVKYQGKIVKGAYWTDKNGDNILIITQTGIRNISDDEREQYIYAYHYINYDDGYSQLWNITDNVKSYCDVDASYIPNTLEIIDLDGDDIAESIFLYKLDDRCDVSPIPIKLMMHKGDIKLVIRGSIGVATGSGEKIKGEKNFDEAFNNVPENFKRYASDKWDEYVKMQEP